MATLRVVTRITASLGSEEVRAETDQSFSLATNVKHDVQRVIANAADSLFWGSALDGPVAFDALMVIVDPDGVFSVEKILDVELLVDGTEVVFAVSSRMPLLLGSELADVIATGTPGAKLIEHVHIFNNDGADAISARVIVLG